VRTRSGRFSIERALSLDELADIASSGGAHQAMTVIDEALADFPAILIGDEEALRVMHGNQVSCPSSLVTSSIGVARLHDPAGRLLALARVVSGNLRPELVFSCCS